MKYDELEKLARLREIGVLTEEEFQREKAKILDDSTSVFSKFSGDQPLFGLQENHYCALLHFSQFLSYIIPVLGVAAPITLWIIGKDKNEKVDETGRNVFDWILSAVIYTLVSIPLIYMLIGFPVLCAIIICAVVFPIVAGVKALDGEIWRYPLSIHFFTARHQSPGSSEKLKKKETTGKPDKDAHFSRRKYG